MELDLSKIDDRLSFQVSVIGVYAFDGKILSRLYHDSDPWFLIYMMGDSASLYPLILTNLSRWHCINELNRIGDGEFKLLIEKGKVAKEYKIIIKNSIYKYVDNTIGFQR